MAEKSFDGSWKKAGGFDQDLNKELEGFFGNRVQKKQLKALIQEHLDFLFNIEDDVKRNEAK